MLNLTIVSKVRKKKKKKNNTTIYFHFFFFITSKFKIIHINTFIFKKYRFFLQIKKYKTNIFQTVWITK